MFFRFAPELKQLRIVAVLGVITKRHYEIQNFINTPILFNIMNIETEIRSFITKEKFEELLDFFKKNASLVKEDYQETFYFDCDEDLRIQRNNFSNFSNSSLSNLISISSLESS